MRRLAFALALVAVALGGLVLINPPYRAFRIPSGILDEERTILERLPAGYGTSGRSYPVLFVLDANPRPSRFGVSFYDVAEEVAALGKPVPELIVLGVRNTHRIRDMVPVPDSAFPPAPGKADAFLRFIEEELIPDAGLFALYALTAALDGGHVPGPGLELGLQFIFAGTGDRPFAAGLAPPGRPVPP